MPSTGEFICLVSNTKQQLMADYQLTLSSAIAPTGGGRVYIDGVSVEGTISDKDFTDQWRIATDASEPLTFALTTLDGNLLAEFVLYDASGNVVFVSTPDSLPEQIQLPSAGTYILLVSRIGGALGGTWGHYSLAINGS